MQRIQICRLRSAKVKLAEGVPLCEAVQVPVSYCADVRKSRTFVAAGLYRIQPEVFATTQLGVRKTIEN